MPAADDTRLRVLDPADGTLVGELEAATPAEVEAAVATARKAVPEWAHRAGGAGGDGARSGGPRRRCR